MLGDLLMDVGVTASGLSATLSQESIKSLKYCLSWLEYAIARTDQCIGALHSILDQMKDKDLTEIKEQRARILAIRHEITRTIRSVIEVASQYASNALPEQACTLVKNILLSLPVRWAAHYGSKGLPDPVASVIRQLQESSDTPSTPVHVPADAMIEESGPTMPADFGPLTPPNGVEDSQDEEQAFAYKILTLANESLDIISSVTHIFRTSMDRADFWSHWLRTFTRWERQSQNGRAVGASSSQSGSRPRLTLGDEIPATTPGTTFVEQKPRSNHSSS